MILVAGEALIDMTNQAGGGGTYVAHPGGGPCNTAVGLARLGAPVAYAGALATDMLGRVLRRHLESAGVDLGLAPATDAPTTLAIASVDDEGTAEYSFYLDGTSACRLGPEHVPESLDAAVSTIYCGTLGLVLEPTASTISGLVLRESGQRVIVVDPNLRPAVIRDIHGYRQRLDTILAVADIVKLSDADALALRPDDPPEAVARGILAMGPAMVVLTRGAAGATAFHGADRVVLPAPEVAVVDTIGAGDSYSSGLLAHLHHNGLLTKDRIRSLAPDELEAALAYAGEVAAVTVSRAGADPPHRSDVDM